MSVLSNYSDRIFKTKKLKEIFDAIDLAFTSRPEKRIALCQVEDLAADGDISNRVIMFTPAGQTINLVDVSIVPFGSASGIDATNTCAITISDGTNTIVSKTFNNTTVFPNAGVALSLGSVSSTYKTLTEGKKVCISVTNGTTANPPAFLVQVAYTVVDA